MKQIKKDIIDDNITRDNELKIAGINILFFINSNPEDNTSIGDGINNGLANKDNIDQISINPIKLINP